MSDLTQIKNDENLKSFSEKNPKFDLSSFNFSDEKAVDLLNWERFDKDTICDRLKMYQGLFKEDIVHSFFEKNPNFNLSSFNFSDESVEALNWEGLDKDKICDRLKMYQGLLNNDKSLKLFFDNNPNFYLANFNFSDEKAVEALKWQGLDKDKICDRLKAYQRLLHLGIAPSEAEKLLEKPLMTGFQGGEQSQLSEPVSALAIASTPEAEFVQTSKLPPEQARETHRKATQATAGRMVLLANAMQFSSPRLGTMLADNAAEVREKFQSLPSYQKLFGSLDYLQCDPCQSIFSPAAYFVDLMRIVEQYIAQVNKENQGFIGLSDRRPDLENIPLTCDNTNDSLPYTQIVSEVLTEKLTKELGEDAFQHLATAKYPGHLPFNLYLEQIRTYLGHLNTNLASIYETFRPQQGRDEIWGRDYLKLSPTEYNLITIANTGDLSDRYGLNISDTDFGGLKKKETFLKQTGLSWQQLKDLLYQNLSPEEIKSGMAAQFYINKKLNGKYLNLNDRGEIENLNLETLDRVDRFLRLARKLDWSFADLDWVLTSIAVEDINEKAIKKIAIIKHLQAQTKLPLDVLCSFWYDMKVIGKGVNPNRPQDLFDRVFNNPLILQGQEKYDTKSAIVWKIVDTDADQETSRLTKSHLIAALQLSDRELTDIVQEIWVWPHQIEIELNVANLFSRLFCISQILKLLGLKVDDYKLLLKFLNESFPSLEKLELDKLTEIIEFAQWLKVSGFSLYELDYILNGTVHPSVEGFLPEDKMAFFMESLWKKVKLPDKQERKNLSEEEIKRLEDELNEKVAIHFGIEPGLFSVLAQLAVQTGKAQDCIQLLLTPVKAEESNWQQIVECFKLISRMRLLVSKLALTEIELRSICDRPQSYNIESLAKLTVKDIENLYKCKNQLVRIFSNSKGDLAKYFEAPSVENLAKLTGWKVEEIQKANDFLTTKPNPNDTKPEPNDTKPEQNKLYNSVEGLLKLKQCFELGATLGCNIDFLCDLSKLLQKDSVANNWEKYQNVARSVISLAKAKYDSEEWAKVFGKLNGTLEERKCKVLTDFALQKLGRENPRQLSEYLLLDVEMTSCACNSQIQLAILSVQTYLQRCRMGIEPGVTQVNIPAVWWEWIMNYRIWEANRKVFLYPENYIDPSLRKNYSPIFKELQDELLQSEITAETVEAAYRNYCDKLAEIGNLQIVEGCCYSVQTPKSDKAVDTLFIFAKTITQPHTFYYRRCEQPTANKPLWRYWEKIDLQINSDYLASVYAFNRLFIFWVETKEIKKSPDNPPTIQATVKYSFLNASQKWVSPQSLVADVEISNILPVALEKDIQDSWQEVYPIVVPATSSKPDPEITILWGGLSAILSKQFNAKAWNLQYKHYFLTKIAGDLLPVPLNFNKQQTSLTLSERRSYLAATAVGNLVVFAGGYNDRALYSDKGDIFAYKEGKLERQETSLTLSERRGSLAATAVGNLVVFAGGYNASGYSDKVDIFAYKDGKLERQETSLTLPQGRMGLAATTVGNLVVFAGGYNASGYSDKVDIFAYKDGKLERQETSLTLPQGRKELAATTVGNLVVFAGGYNASGYSDKVDIFAYKDGKLERQETSLTLPQGRMGLAATTVGNLVVFAGGYNASGYSDKV
ncbi:neuraminidase-like domain-containing protein, partial [Ancylothrix sp. C2]|uniref:neuraminidase-like domain-containing protein n=1 Tax=Ancylothrix sp. D3o TaxID=2953691 RepID=UPI0021BB3274